MIAHLFILQDIRMRIGCAIILLIAVVWVLIVRTQYRETLENPAPQPEPKKKTPEPDILIRVGKLESEVSGITSQLTSLQSQFNTQQSEINQAQAQVNAASAQFSQSTAS
jgi:hypothetical protein